jgi:hypothetical protein
LTVACTLIVPVTELAPEAVLAASCTALSALPGEAAALPGEAAAPVALAVEPELAPQPAMAAAATAASPATCHRRPAKPALMETSEV